METYNIIEYNSQINYNIDKMKQFKRYFFSFNIEEVLNKILDF